ncbi:MULTISPECIES: hypothetical protein [Chelatococcus]|uniref:Transposase-like protein n=1 Tax=Chelatococcus caeni TaxID=1348468 RepID=A0A840C5F0_9HYPH|nr:MULTISPECIES: hypothetical protein [Chelatococcus]ALA16117.1 hypothetical protein AL346_00290 [Chelatococcus sp. CO-6]MBB4017627.1 transposase-like protein [Chelatococcus caeni]
MPTPPINENESRRRKEAIEAALRGGANPFNVDMGGRGSAVQVAARMLGIHDATLTNWVRRQRQLAEAGKPNFEPDWSLFRSGAVAAQPREDLAAKVAAALRTAPASLEELSSRFGITAAQALSAVETLRSTGVSVMLVGERFEVARQHQPAWTAGEPLRIYTDANNRLVFGAIGDNHAGSKYSRWDVVDDLYDRFAAAGVEHVFHTGNWIDGEARFNKYDIDTAGLDNQCRELANRWPEREGISTYAVWGDDHEGWYAQREGVDVGRYCQSTFRQAGREDWHDLGFMEAHVEIVNANTGKSVIMAVVHPGGGTAYALSYRPQKIIESLEGGTKPAIILLGHYHKLDPGLVRNVWYLQTGCCQDQTPFMRKKSIEAHVGGAIVEIEQDPATGAIIGFNPGMIRYFNRGYYAGRDQWSHHGPVAQVPRSVGGV